MMSWVGFEEYKIVGEAPSPLQAPKCFFRVPPNWVSKHFQRPPSISQSPLTSFPVILNEPSLSELRTKLFILCDV